ncbi:serine hydrolase domain-containing protein [Chryseobacterium indologenes]|uniref:serine hydrolase domain-containing protein n=1 Tax=Chryseobacterium indologenes TaxID=253 RepID=UPI000788EDD7|nr:serine hydrolase domain-containing protein [Chryseobacterium indologenes]
MKKVYLILILNFFGILSAQNPDYKKPIDSLLSYLQEKDAFSGSVLLQKNGETIYSGNFNKFPNSSNEYRIGSVTKIFTAIITFQLIEEGKFSLNSKLNQYFPDIKNSEKITIGNMLNHTSGIYDYLQWEDYYSKKNNVFSKDEILKLINLGKPDFKPGEDISYSNSNYILLGYIIENVTGKSFEENLKQRIINQLNLKNTYYETSESEYSKRNISYLYNGEKWLKETDTHPSFTLSAGAVVSTAEDITNLMDALFNGKLVSKNSLAQMETVNTKAFGYGLQIAPFYKKTGYGHTGRIDEFHSTVSYFPDDKLSLVILSNGNTVKLNTIAIGILSKYYGKKYNYPDFRYESKTSLSTDRFTGVYHAKLAGIITVAKFQISKAGKNHLFLSMYNNGKEGEKRLLIPKNENTFYSPENDAEFDFTFNKKGNVTGAKLTQGKQSINCKKTI